MSARQIAFGRSRDAVTEIEWPMKNVPGSRGFWGNGEPIVERNIH